MTSQPNSDPQEEKPTMRPCVTHHFACDCRERKYARLRDAASDALAALELTAYVNAPVFEKLEKAIEATYE